MKNILFIFVVILFFFSSCAQSELSDATLLSRGAQIGISSDRSHIINFQNTGTYEDFLLKILTFESDVDPARAAEYKKNYYSHDKVYTYQKVSVPGRVVRDVSGNPESQTLELRDFFGAIGILTLYNPDSSDPATMFKTMQYSVVNYLGFIGYQFSESDLQVLGYYNYARDGGGNPIYYIDVDVSNWANGVRDKIMDIKQPDGSYQKVHVTDVNRWAGSFTGKNGISSLADFKSQRADAIAKDHFTFKYNNIVKLLDADNRKIEDFIGKTLAWDELTPKLEPPKGMPDKVTITYSGLLAGAHLRGAEGVYQLLVQHQNPQDESGTSILSYVYRFGGFETPWGK